jgi:DNA repair exonuclease SbcCD nuclease subunit
MRFLHAADLHLGLRVTRFGAAVNDKVREARLQALEQMVLHPRVRDVEFLLIAGDLFDDNHVDAVTSKRALELLELAKKPVYVIPGNHDPLTADSVYHRPPWTSGPPNVTLIRTREPVPLPGGLLLPCPLFATHSSTDPTRWIVPAGEGDTHIRVGLAHGSLNDRPNLHPDDHLIARDVVDQKHLDYLALGHWHRPSRHTDCNRVVRAAYPGVHEPMGFSGSADFAATGWSPYSDFGRAADGGLFADDGKGRALIVTIDGVEAHPVIEEIETGQLEWRDEQRTLRDEAELSALIDELARRPNQGRQLLRLALSGTLPAHALNRLAELDASRVPGEQGGIKCRYAWFDLDDRQLRAEPDDAELKALAGSGVARAVCDALQAEATGADPVARDVARQSLLLLYRYAQEVRP